MQTGERDMQESEQADHEAVSEQREFDWGKCRHA
jgi:hypothetical protein